MSQETKLVIKSDKYDDLAQAVKKGAVSKTDLALILAVYSQKMHANSLNGEEDGK